MNVRHAAWWAVLLLLGFAATAEAEVKTVMVPGIPEPRTLVVVAKTRPTPHEYPRRPGVPTRRPLGRTTCRYWSVVTWTAPGSISGAVATATVYAHGRGLAHCSPS